MKTLPRKITLGKKYEPAMEIADQAQADAYFELLVNHSMRFGKTREEAEALERSNLGYFAGYCDHETRLRVERLFRCVHPIFGPASNGKPDPEFAIKLGEFIGRMAGRGTPPFPV
jgi:hypothetical protein